MTLASFIVWAAFAVVLFFVVPPRIAAAAALVTGWLFLPIGTYAVFGLPDVDKRMAIAAAIMLGSCLVDSGRWRAWRPHWLDVPVALVCTTGLATSFSNRLGLYDGLSTVVNQTAVWGIPYLIGRVYFADLAGLRVLAMGIFAGALAYAPLCIMEVLAGPHLHSLLYAPHIYGLPEVARFGGWRPQVFLESGLMVAVWMVAGALIAAWCASSRAVSRLGPVPMGVCAALLAVVTVVLKSVNGWVLLALGFGIMTAIRLNAGRVVMAILIAAAPLYVTLRAARLWNGAAMMSMATPIVGPDRAGSLGFRVRNEKLLLQKSMRRPLLGWGGWRRSQLHLEDGVVIGVSDSLWIRELGRRGIVGLVGAFVLLLEGPMAFWRRYAVDQWLRPPIAPGAALAVVVALFAIDCCMNAMINPVYVAAIGGLVGTALRNETGRTALAGSEAA